MGNGDWERERGRIKRRRKIDVGINIFLRETLQQKKFKWRERESCTGVGWKAIYGYARSCRISFFFNFFC